MAAWVRNKKVDLQDGGLRDTGSARVVYGEALAHVWRATVLDGGVAADLTGEAVWVEVVRLDGGTVTFAGVISGNVATAVFPGACYAYVGPALATLWLINATTGARQVLDRLNIIVEEGATSTAVDPGDEVESLPGILALLDSIQVAEAARVAAETARSYSATNLFANGDLAGGTTASWAGSNGTLSVVSGALRHTLSAVVSTAMILQSATAVVGHVYYLACNIKPFRAHVPIAYLGGTYPSAQASVPAGESVRVSFRATATTATTSQGVYVNGTVTTGMVIGNTTDFDDLILLDLTAIFGAGNEPTAAVMDVYLARWTDGWFTGTTDLAAETKELPALLAIKAQLDEKTGYGVLSGAAVTAQATPNMTVAVAAGICYLSTGRRFAIAAVSAQAISAADATNPRIDIVYVDAFGVVRCLAGTAAASPVAPTLPTGALLLAEISVAANATTITSAVIRDRRRLLFAPNVITPTFVNSWGPYATLTAAAGYYKDQQTGRVKGFGTISGGTAGTAALTLLAGDRPAAGRYFIGRSGGGTTGSLTVSASGTVTVDVFSSWISLDQIDFIAGQ